MWSARAPRANAERYASHLRDDVLSMVKRLPGYKGATLLERDAGAEVEITVVTWWRSMDDIRAFAPEIDRAVVTDPARALLSAFDKRVRHFRVALDDEPELRCFSP